MKSVRVLVIATMCLLVGYGVSVTLRAWGQSPEGGASAGNGSPSQTGQYFFVLDRREADAEMDKLVQEEAAAEREVASLIESYGHTEGDGVRSNIKSKLEAALEKEFDLQQKRRDLELTRVEARLEKVRELMKKRGDARQSIIDKRLDQLLREADGLGWTPPPGVNLRQNNPYNWFGGKPSSGDGFYGAKPK